MKSRVVGVTEVSPGTSRDLLSGQQTNRTDRSHVRYLAGLIEPFGEIDGMTDEAEPNSASIRRVASGLPFFLILNVSDNKWQYSLSIDIWTHNATPSSISIAIPSLHFFPPRVPLINDEAAMNNKSKGVLCPRYSRRWPRDSHGVFRRPCATELQATRAAVWYRTCPALMVQKHAFNTAGYCTEERRHRNGVEPFDESVFNYRQGDKKKDHKSVELLE